MITLTAFASQYQAGSICLWNAVGSWTVPGRGAVVRYTYIIAHGRDQAREIVYQAGNRPGYGGERHWLQRKRYGAQPVIVRMVSP
jgi:hypothetical protein